MKKLVILGAGTAGTMMLNKLVPVLDPDEWQITIVDQDQKHYYQPGFLFIPFGIYGPEDVVKPKRNFFPPGANVIFAGIDVIEPSKNRVRLADGQVVSYDWLIVATGAKTAPEETEGLQGDGWYKNIFDFYTVEGATALGEHLQDWKGGRLVINIVEMPIKCPVAPLEFAFLADWWFTEQGIRDKVELEFVTPLSHAFTKPVAARYLGGFLEQKNIKLTTDFSTGSVDTAKNRIVSWDDKEIGYDLLVTLPTNTGGACIERSEMGDELNFIPTHKHTLLSKDHPNIFVIGDATDLPASKAGSVAHFEADILFENFRRAIAGRPLKEDFDGHANCFIESGFGKGLLIDFNYDVEPLPGKFPLPGLGPLSLLQESRLNHYSKMMFRWVYWNLLLRGAELPLEPQMSMCGKRNVA